MTLSFTTFFDSIRNELHKPKFKEKPMGISLMTALEINNHPSDLYVQIGKPQGSEQYAIQVSRGPGHSYKMLISSQPFADTVEQAVEQVKALLKGIHSAAEDQMNDAESPTTKILSGVTDRSKTLTPDLIDRIIAELREHQYADTSQMLATTS